MNFSNEIVSRIIDLGIMSYMNHLENKIKNGGKYEDDDEVSSNPYDYYDEGVKLYPTSGNEYDEMSLGGRGLECNYEMTKKITLAIICCVMILFIPLLFVALVRLNNSYRDINRVSDDYIIYRGKGGSIIEELQ